MYGGECLHCPHASIVYEHMKIGHIYTCNSSSPRYCLAQRWEAFSIPRVSGLLRPHWKTRSHIVIGNHLICSCCSCRLFSYFKSSPAKVCIPDTVILYNTQQNTNTHSVCRVIQWNLSNNEIMRQKECPSLSFPGSPSRVHNEWPLYPSKLNFARVQRSLCVCEGRAWKQG